MSIEVVSTSVKSESVQSDVINQAVENTKSAPAQKEQGETAEDSEALEETDSEDTLEGEESPESDTKTEEAGKPKKKSGIQKKFSKLTSKLTEREREVEYWKAEALKHQKTEKPAQEKPVEAKAAESTKPTADQFDTHDAYVDALTDWKIDQREMKKETKAKEESVKSEFDKQLSSHVERVQAFKKSHDDFDEVMEEIGDIPMSLTVQEVILASEEGPALMYELAKNPDEFKRICALGAVAAARELGKFEAKIAKSAEPAKEIKTTKAPPPIKTLSAKGATATKSLHDMSYEEFKLVRAEQMKKSRG